MTPMSVIGEHYHRGLLLSSCWKPRIWTCEKPHDSLGLQLFHWQRDTRGQRSPTFLAPGSGFVEDNFPQTRGGEKASGWFRLITCTVHFISIIITSAPAQISRYQIPEVGDPNTRELLFTRLYSELHWYVWSTTGKLRETANARPRTLRTDLPVINPTWNPEEVIMEIRWAHFPVNTQSHHLI